MFKALALITLSASPAYADDAKQDCHDPNIMVPILAERYPDRKQWSGLTNAMDIVTVYFDEANNGKWIMVITSPTKLCILAAGSLSAVIEAPK